MEVLLKCKVCGFVIKGSELGDKCPACGAGKKAFDEYYSDLNRERRKKLNLHIHPISVHFPEAISILLALLVFSMFFSYGSPGIQLLMCVRYLSVFLPFTVILAMIAGMYDGKLRYKKLSTPYLKKKIVLALGFEVFSILNAILISDYSGNITDLIIIFAISIIIVLIGGLLGLIGGRMLDSYIPDTRNPSNK